MNSEYVKQACPLCQADAEYCWVDMGNRKYFHCPRCGYFQVSRRAEVLLNESDGAVREHFSRLAKKTPPGMLFVILMPKPSASGELVESFDATHVLKSDAPLR